MDERESLGKSLFSDYVASGDLEESVGTAQELEAPGFMPKLVQVRQQGCFWRDGGGECAGVLGWGVRQLGRGGPAQ